MPIISILTLLLCLCMPVYLTLATAEQTVTMSTMIKQRMLPLQKLPDLDPLLQRCANKKLILLGDGTHGSKEFYYLRRLISMRLVEQQRIDFIALEADWYACCAIDNYVRALPGAAATATQALQGFTNWRSWIWKNEEMVLLLNQLRSINLKRPPQQRVAIYGMDMLDYGNSLNYLTTVPGFSAYAQTLQSCLVNSAGISSPYPAPHPCNAALENLFQQVTTGARIFPRAMSRADFTNGQHVQVIRNGAAYYHTQDGINERSWNLRINHFTYSTYQLMKRHGSGARGIIWAHNTHVGDARATTMASYDMISLGQVLRQQLGAENVLLLGQTSYSGTVYACREWNDPATILTMPPAADSSTEAMLHANSSAIGMWLFSAQDTETALNKPRGQRAIGVIYNPDVDTTDNYVTTRLTQRYDALIFIDTTTALEPLSVTDN